MSFSSRCFFQKRTNSTLLLWNLRSTYFCSFLEEIENAKITFWNQLTFKQSTGSKVQRACLSYVWCHLKSRSVCVKQTLNTRCWLVNALVTWHISYKIMTLLPLKWDLRRCDSTLKSKIEKLKNFSLLPWLPKQPKNRIMYHQKPPNVGLVI